MQSPSSRPSRPRRFSRESLAARSAIAALAAVIAVGGAAALPADVAGRRTIDLPSLLDLPGDLVQVRYTPGTLDRAAAVQKRFELLADEFSHTGWTATAMVIYVLSPEDWAAAGLARAYGEPETLATDGLALPAWADGPLVTRVRGWLGRDIPLPAGLPLLATREEAGALAICDLLAEIAGARLLVERAQFFGDRIWIAPVVTQLVARLAWDRYEPGRMLEIAALVDAMAARDTTPGGHALAGWNEKLPLPARVWFEARFLRAADLIVVEKGARGAQKILAKAVKGKAPLTEAMLFKKIPALAGWLAQSFPPDGPPAH